MTQRPVPRQVCNFCDCLRSQNYSGVDFLEWAEFVVLFKDFLEPLGLSVNALATALRVPATRLHEIVKERRGVSADTAARLARYFGGDARSWLNLQATYDLKTLPTASAIEREVLRPAVRFRPP